VPSGRFMQSIEKVRTPVRYLGNQYVGGGAATILEKLKNLNQTGKKSSSATAAASGQPQTEESARNVLGASESSSRGLVSSP
jgi:nitrate reductase beta subunit